MAGVQRAGRSCRRLAVGREVVVKILKEFGIALIGIALAGVVFFALVKAGII